MKNDPVETFSLVQLLGWVAGRGGGVVCLSSATFAVRPAWTETEQTAADNRGPINVVSCGRFLHESSGLPREMLLLLLRGHHAMGCAAIPNCNAGGRRCHSFWLLHVHPSRVCQSSGDTFVPSVRYPRVVVMRCGCPISTTCSCLPLTVSTMRTHFSMSRTSSASAR